MDINELTKIEKDIITVKEAKKLLGANYRDIDDDIIAIIIKELEQLATIAFMPP